MGRSRALCTQIRWGLVALVAMAAPAAALTGGASAAKVPPDKLRALKPVADTYVTAARPRANFGASPVLRVDGTPKTVTYLRFELAKIRGEITGVTLLLHSRSAVRTSYAVRQVIEDEWRERRLTYANAPQASLRYMSGKPVRRGTWSAIDVTAFVDSADEVSLAITTRGARELSFGSRESRHSPRLVVRFKRHSDLEERVLDALLRR